MLIPLFNTLWRVDPDKNIPDSIESGEGVNVFMGIGRGRGNIFGVEEWARRMIVFRIGSGACGTKVFNDDPEICSFKPGISEG